MIPRYTRPEIAAIWSDESRFAIWLEVETRALEGMVGAGLAPVEALSEVREKGRFDTNRVLEIERQVKHDVIAFLTNVTEHVGPLGRFLHRGMTSSDLLDTTFGIQLVRSSEIILRGLDEFLAVLRKRADEFKRTPCIGRSHGIHAEPTTFGLKVLTWYAEMRRAKERFQSAIQEIAVGKIAGAVGTYASIPPSVEAVVLKSFGLRAESVPTQIVARDRHAAFFNALALIGASIERIATEVRHLQRTEVREAEEEFTKGQKGSSAMPHKRNPILSENLCGLSRLLRGYALSASENVALWHERDISHSSVERVIAPDACIIADFMIARATGLVRNLVVYPERMLENLNVTRGLVFSGTLLLALTDKGMRREDAYAAVQRHSLAAWEGGKTLRERVSEDNAITNLLSTQEIDGVFSVDRHMAHVDFIFARTYGEEK